jgi:hypothetical protein
VPRYEGRLELTWTNKHERLLAHDYGPYEWLSPSDYRVAEDRLLRLWLRPDASFGQADGASSVSRPPSRKGATCLA